MLRPRPRLRILLLGRQLGCDQDQGRVNAMDDGHQMAGYRFLSLAVYSIYIRQYWGKEREKTRSSLLYENSMQKNVCRLWCFRTSCVTARVLGLTYGRYHSCCRPKVQILAPSLPSALPQFETLQSDPVTCLDSTLLLACFAAYWLP